MTTRRRISIWLPTRDTEHMTMACVRTLILFNKEVDLDIWLFCSVPDMAWPAKLAAECSAHDHDIRLIDPGQHLSHDSALWQLWHADTDNEYVVLLDSDVTFHVEGVLLDMRKAFVTEDIFLDRGGTDRAGVAGYDRNEAAKPLDRFPFHSSDCTRNCLLPND